MNIIAKPLAPYGREYLQVKPSAGPWIAIGPDAWDYAAAKHLPIMVCPYGDNPHGRHWPVRGEQVFVIETGPPDDPSLRSLAEALFAEGATGIVAARLSKIERGKDGRVFIEPVREMAA